MCFAGLEHSLEVWQYLCKLKLLASLHLVGFRDVGASSHKLVVLLAEDVGVVEHELGDPQSLQDVASPNEGQQVALCAQDPLPRIQPLLQTARHCRKRTAKKKDAATSGRRRFPHSLLSFLAVKTPYYYSSPLVYGRGEIMLRSWHALRRTYARMRN